MSEHNTETPMTPAPTAPPQDDDELMEEFTAMIRRDAATITNPDELAAMSAVVNWVMSGK